MHARLLAFGATLLTCAFSLASAAAGPPNVVMIIGDDQSWTDFGFMGHPVIRTPNLDRLASQSLVFSRGHVPSSLCRPSLATLVTGLYPHQHKIATNYPNHPADSPLEAIPKISREGEYWRKHQEMLGYIEKSPTLPRMLAKRGYLSLQTGKWWEGHYSRAGFTSGMTLGIPHSDPQRPIPRVAGNWLAGDKGLWIGREEMKPIFDFIDQAGDQPFFVWYAPMLPHGPHNPPKRLLDKYTSKTDSIHIARYWAMCEWFDETCGELLNYLDQKSLADNTLVAFVSDNGWISQPDSGRPDPRSKRSPYEGGVRTPILLRWPDRIKPRRDDQTPIMSVDLAPTILAACGLEPTADMQGVDLLDRDALARRKVVFGENFHLCAADMHNPAANLRYRWAIEGRWKLIVPNKANEPDGQVELYDLEVDPHETRNLAAAHPKRMNDLRVAIDTWWPAK